jgi:protease-4
MTDKNTLKDNNETQKPECDRVKPDEPRKKGLINGIKSRIRCAKRRLFKDKDVALVKIDGIIMDSTNFPVAKKVIKALKEVENREIKTLVIRINSPGGTVGASQEIYNAIERLKAKDTLIVASCGEVCASGGVYIASACSKIVANPGTITGSIGVIIKSSSFKALYEKIGIASEVIKSGPYKDILSSHRLLTDEEKELLQGMIDNTYNQFVDVVARGRNIDHNIVKTFADGRIFTGEQALEYGMIDKMGSLKDAIYYAAELAGIEEEPNVVDVSPKKSMFSQMVSSRMQNIELMTEYSGVPLWLMP